MVPTLVKAIVKHYTLEDIQTFVERQEKRTKIDKDRAEIMIFGPFIRPIVREVQIDVKVRIDLTLTIERNKYKWAQVAQRYVDQAFKPLHVVVLGEDEEFENTVSNDFCLSQKDVKVLYHGGTEFLEYGTVEITYQHIGDMI